jgi:hypothetical protein
MAEKINKPTFKQLVEKDSILSTDSGDRMVRRVFTGKANGKPAWSDGFMMEVSQVPDKWEDDKDYHEMPKEGNYAKFLDTDQYSAYAEPVASKTIENGLDIVLLSNRKTLDKGETQRASAIQKKYHDYFKSKYPDARFIIKGGSSNVVVESKGERVGAVMPINLDMGQVSEMLKYVPLSSQKSLEKPLQSKSTPEKKDKTISEWEKRIKESNEKIKRLKSAEIYETPQKYIIAGTGQFEKTLKAFNGKIVTPKEAGWIASDSAYYFDNPYFKGYVTTNYNEFYGDIIRADRFSDKNKEIYDKIVKESGKRVFTFYDLMYYFHKKEIENAIAEGKSVPAEVLKDYPELEKKVSKPVQSKSTPPKKETRQYTQAELKGIHESRSPQSKAMDEMQSHQVTLEPDSPRVARWVRDQGYADIRGIDTPSRKKKRTVKKAKRKTSPATLKGMR